MKSVVSIVDVLEELHATRGIKCKSEILRQHKDDELFITLLRVTYDRGFIFNIQHVDVPDVDGDELDIPSERIIWEEFLSALIELSNDDIRGNSARERIHDIVSRAGPRQRAWMLRVISRQLDVGISTKTINNVYGDVIDVFECQLATRYSPEHMVDVTRVACEPKLNGVRLIIMSDGDDVNMFTRQGKLVSNFHDTIGSDIKWLVKHNSMGPLVFDGELIGGGFESIMKLLFKRLSTHQYDVIDGVTYHVTDVMTLDEWNDRSPKSTYLDMRSKLEDMMIDINCSFVKTVESRVIDVDDIQSVHESYVTSGYEGTMIRLLDSTYTWGTTRSILELKDWMSLELKVVGFSEGTKTYRGCLGSFIVDHNGRKIHVGRGTLSHDQARHVWNERTKYRGSMIEDYTTGITDDGMLQSPQFIRFRDV